MKLKTIAILFLTLSSATSFAATTLRDAVEQTVLRNPEIRAKWLEFRASGKEQDVARGGYYPQINIQGIASAENLQDPKNNTGNFNHPSYNIEFRQMLFDGFATSEEVRRLGYGSLTRYYDLLATSDAAALETTNAYLDVLRYRKLVELASDNYAIHKETYNQIVERVEAGVGRRVDLEMATGRLALAESNWLTESSNLLDVSARYERLTGVAPDAVMSDVPDLGSFSPKDLNNLKDGLRNNPSFLAAIYNIRSARAAATAKKSGFYPQLYFRAAHGYDKNRDNIDGNYRDSKAQLIVDYNIFRGGSDVALASQYAEQLNITYELRDKACRDLRQTTQIAWNDTYRLTEQRKYLDQHVLSTEKARDAFRRQFDIGQRSLLDLLDTENELFEAKRALVRAEYDHQLSYARVLTQAHELLAALQISPLENIAPDSDLGGAEAEDDKANCLGALIPTVPLDREAALAGRPPRIATPVIPVTPETPASNNSCDKSITEMVESWRSQWAEKKVDAYLAQYASQFEASGQRTRADWESKRRSRLSKEGAITLKFDNLSCSNVSKDQAKVTFKQSYSSSNYQDNVEKTLDLVSEGGKWKIKREQVTSGRSE
ncbi:TolC family outer membrane protein [uncultured Deefgea sp.]|uniref:TolC family outer membrane protein n=1 Tax=uncultured Deefgea sp. TaxID=1304914 RepID=UPI00260F5CF0|nr:TolC family outer membrane protein [uncultured Deefgea sp.]